MMTGRDMLADGLKPIPHAVRTGHPADIKLDNTDGSPPFIPPHYPLATDEVRHVWRTSWRWSLQQAAPPPRMRPS